MQQTNNTLNQSKKERAQLDHTLLDVGLWDKPKLKAFRLKFGHLARLWFLDMVDAMSGATNATIDLDLAIGLGLEIGLKNSQELIEYCLEKGILLSEAEGTISNRRVIEDQESLAEKRRRWRAGKADSKENLTRNCKEEQKTLNVHKCEDLNTEDLKIRSNKNGAPEILVAEIRDLVERFPAFPCDSTGTAIIKWAQSQDEKFKKYFGSQEVEALLMSYQGREKDLAPDIYSSIAAGYRTVYPKAKANAPNGNGQHKKTNFERNMEILKASDEKYRNKQNLSSTIGNVSKLSAK